jgi:hypothetical protein
LSVVTRLVLAVIVCAARVAAAGRCEDGVEAAHARDLPRAALLLDGCDVPEASEVQHALGESNYSSIVISTTPPGLAVETTAMPGEKLTSPVTVWAKAGTYDVKVYRDDRVYTQTVKLEPHSRVPVVITASAPKATAPHDQVADFSDENAAEAPESGPPPDQKHPSLIPCKYANACTEHGGELDDPFGDGPAGPHDAARVPWRAGLRVGGGVAHVGSIAMTLGAAGALRLAPRLAATARIEWTRREAGMAGLDAVAAASGVATPVAMTDLAMITAGVAARGELRFGDMFDMRPVRSSGLAADATLDVVLRQMPIVVGARVTQGITPLVASSRETAVLLELGLEIR